MDMYLPPGRTEEGPYFFSLAERTRKFMWVHQHHHATVPAVVIHPNSRVCVQISEPSLQLCRELPAELLLILFSYGWMPLIAIGVQNYIVSGWEWLYLYLTQRDIECETRFETTLLVDPFLYYKN